MNGGLNGKLKSLPWELQTEEQTFSRRGGTWLAAGRISAEWGILVGRAATHELWRAV